MKISKIYIPFFKRRKNEPETAFRKAGHMTDG